jgi:2-polyprenyl-3-methyl-5-hydroxy-6-metoxy-1,4-benzoquinol methylase
LEVTVQIIDIVKRVTEPAPWSEGDKIPWNEPEFSERMLREHLSQEHDLASRRSEIVDGHVTWIHNTLLGRKPAKILDLGCGPGLYASRLARLGHSCVGIDYSPASIRYAREQAAQEQSKCTYVHEDVRKADFGKGYDLVMFLYGELNVFRRADATAILTKAHSALAPGGTLLIEPHRFVVVEKAGTQPPSWHTAEAGLFSEKPHLWLQENSWNQTTATATTRWFVIDAATGQVQQLTQTMQAYTDEEYQRMLAEAGFEGVEFLPSFGGAGGRFEDSLMVIVAQRAGA